MVNIQIYPLSQLLCYFQSYLKDFMSVTMLIPLRVFFQKIMKQNIYSFKQFYLWWNFQNVLYLEIIHKVLFCAYIKKMDFL